MVILKYYQFTFVLIYRATFNLLGNDGRGASFGQNGGGFEENRGLRRNPWGDVNNHEKSENNYRNREMFNDNAERRKFAFGVKNMPSGFKVMI